jgi:hypothetical protein
MQVPSRTLSPTISIGLTGSNHSSPSNLDPVSTYLSSFKIQPHSTKSSAAVPAQRFDNQLHSYRGKELSYLLTDTNLNGSFDTKNYLNVKSQDKSPKRRFSVQPPSFAGYSFSSSDEKGSPLLSYQSTDLLRELSVPSNNGTRFGTTLTNTYLPSDMLSGYSPSTYSPTTFSPQTYSPTTSIPYLSSVDLSNFNLKIEPVVEQSSTKGKYELNFLTSLARKLKENTHANNKEITKRTSSSNKPENILMEERSPLRKLNLYGIEKDLIAQVDQIIEKSKKQN